MESTTLLRISGAVAQPLNLTFDDLRAMSEADHVADVSAFHPKRQGTGVWLDALLRRAQVDPEARYLTLHAERDDFHASVPLAAIRGEGVVVYRLGNDRLPVENGGPVRFLIRDPAACHTDELDDCANVKYVNEIEVTVGRGRDTRPADEREHKDLHDREAAG